MTKAFAIQWFKFACVLTVAVGFIAAAASYPQPKTLWLLLFDLLKWPLDGDPAGFAPTGYALNAVLGGVMVGWGLTLYFLADGPLADNPRDISKVILVGLIAWFMVDSAGSFAANLPGNVVLNVMFLALFLPPLFALMRK